MNEVLSAPVTAPALQEIAKALRDGFAGNFEEFSIDVVDCPDLTKGPFYLAAEGLCGSAFAVQVGSKSYIFPEPKLDKRYNIETIVDLCRPTKSQSFAIGSGAGPWFGIGVMCEMMMNARIGLYRYIHTHVAKVDAVSGECVTGTDSTGDFAIYGSFLVSDGRPGKVIKIKSEKSLTGCSFPGLIQKILARHSQSLGSNITLGLGGVFLLQAGKARIKIAPDFSKSPIRSQEEMENYYKYYNFSAPLTCLSVIISGDIPGLNVDLEHTHCFSDHDEGGHYCGTTTPSEAKFEGYFVPVEKFYRVDKPE